MKTDLRVRHFIDSYKAFTAMFIICMMAKYEQWENRTLWIYLATHGVYCVLWLHKSVTFGDKNFEEPIGPEGIMIFPIFSPFWISPWYIASQKYEAPAWLLGIATGTFVVGMFYHFVSDMQKNTHLNLRKNSLITNGLWARTRNPNYFGEFLTYLGFSLLACHWITFVGFAFIIAVVWIPSIKKKEASLSRYPEFEEYKNRSGIFFPRFF